MRQVVITADDFGIAAETNAAVEVAHREGVLTSASIMTNMPGFAEAVAMARRNPRLGLGVHLVLTSGRSVASSDRIPLLVDRAGRFRYGYLALSRLLFGPNRAAATRQIRHELEAQLDKARQSNLDIDHLDGHRHVHMIPAIWPLVGQLARDCGGLIVRTAVERPGWNPSGRRGMTNLVKTLVLGACARANQTRPPLRVHFAGVMDSGCVNVRVLRRLLRELPDGISEIATHPSLAIPAHPADAGLCCSAEDDAFLRSRSRVSELEALLNHKVRDVLEERQIEAVSFRICRAPAGGASAAAAAC